MLSCHAMSLRSQHHGIEKKTVFLLLPKLENERNLLDCLQNITTIESVRLLNQQ